MHLLQFLKGGLINKNKRFLDSLTFCQYAFVGVASHLVLFGKIQNCGLRSYLTCHFAAYEVYWLLGTGVLYTQSI